ncbi:22575_t:CDS:2, partial [Gigaspora rosea]
LTMSSMDSHGNAIVFTMLAFIHYNIHKQANDLALINPNSYTYFLLQVLDRIKNKQWSEAKVLWVESLPSYSKLVNDQNLIVVKSTVTTICDSEYCPKRVLPLANCYDIILIKTQASILPESNYFETYFKQWKEPYIVPCESEFKTMNGEKPKKIPISAFRFDKCTSVETGKTKQIDQWLPLILVINVTGINIIDKEKYLENKDLPEEISFPPDDVHIKQRYILVNF